MAITQAKELRFVLIVDDSPTARKQIEESFGDNWRTETAENGAQALDKFSKLRPSIVTLDVNMPIIAGYETLRKILTIDKDTKVIMISSVENEEILRKCFEGGAMAYIVKPFSSEEISNTLEVAEKINKEYRKTVFIFSRLIREIKNIMENIGYQHVTVLLKDIKILHPDKPISIASSDIHKIVNIELGSAKSPKKPEGYKGFVTEIDMRNEPGGIIITWIKTDSLARLREDYEKVELPYDQTLESVKIFHDKVAAEMSIIMGGYVCAGDVKPVEVSDDDFNKYYKKMCDKLDGAFAKYEISCNDVVVPIEVHLYFNIHMLFTRRF